MRWADAPELCFYDYADLLQRAGRGRTQSTPLDSILVREMGVVPRVGETVILGTQCYEVVVVEHHYAERATINVYLEPR